MPATLNDAKAVCRRSVEIMADGSIEDFEAVVHPDAVNREAKDEPPACRGQGPAAFHATAVWLRDAFADLHWNISDVIAEGDLVTLHCTMSGRQVRTFCNYGPDGRVSAAFPPSGRRFTSTQTHWFRIANGKIIEHWANRDDLGMSMQLGWMSPLSVLRMLLATRRARSASLSSFS